VAGARAKVEEPTEKRARNQREQRQMEVAAEKEEKVCVLLRAREAVLRGLEAAGPTKTYL
jgi:hypothetical protein